LNRIDESYRFCREIARREGSNFYWGFRFLPHDERQALEALYAFARRTDDIVDDENSSEKDRAKKIELWREETISVFNGNISEEPILLALGDSVKKFEIPKEELLLLIDGCRDDLYMKRYSDLAATLSYCRKVAVTVGLSMLAIFRARGEDVRRAMESIGYAFQLTNILRDIPEDMRRDRIYLPLDLLNKFGVAESDLLNGTNINKITEVIKEVEKDARKYYKNAVPLYSKLPKDAARTMKVMSRVYEGILDKIVEQNYDVWKKRPRLSKAQKISIVVKTMLGW